MGKGRGALSPLRSKALQMKSREQYGYILPAVITLGLVVVFPTVFLYYISLTNYDLAAGFSRSKFVGFANFGWLFTVDRDFWYSILITFGFMAITVPLEFVIGFAIALLFNRKMRWKRLWMSFLIVPMVATPAIVSLIWKLMLNSEYGVLNFLLSGVHLPVVNWLGYHNALLSLMMVEVWEWTPFMSLILYAGIRSLPLEPFEAANIDGASPLQSFRFITLPLLRPIILIAFMLRFIDALKVFDIVYGLTQGGPGRATEIFSLHIFRLGFGNMNWIGRASAAAVILMLLATPLITMLAKLMRRGYTGGA
jgi:multiple sugar transport system permease protein